MSYACDGRNDCRLACARDTLDHDRAVLAGQRQSSRGNLLGIELVGARYLPQAPGCLGSFNDGLACALSGGDIGKGCPLDCDMLGRGESLRPAIEPVALALEHPPVGHQHANPRFNPISGHTLHPKVERGLDQLAPGPGGFTFADDPDRRSGCHLSAQLRGRQSDPLQAIGCQCVCWPSVELGAVAERTKSLLDTLRRPQRAFTPLGAAFPRLFDQRLGIEPQPGSAPRPFLPKRLLIIRIELGIAGALGDFTQGFCVVSALPEFLGRCQNGQATLAEGFACP